ncbi:YncE family protein [Corynebacterium mendelii]|uniref:YncE family protein n=1 Tax=Corynebacterium mendelii TaxID=2765362 RepID=A0A939IXE6_9CORY|nr:YncE family protein [Corynebacterium mendelii]MBN9644390.1 YncE family protein [Corynebacterium mendelii]
MLLISSRSATHRIGRKAIAALATTAMLTAGIPAVAYAADDTTTDQGSTQGVKGKVAANGAEFKKPELSGPQKVTAAESVEAGKGLLIQGTGYTEGDQITIKFLDGDKSDDGDPLPQWLEQDPDVFEKLDKSSGASVVKQPVGDNGTFSVYYKVPKNIPAGWYWVRVLIPGGSKVAWFKVTPSTNPGGGDEETTPAAKLIMQQPGSTRLPRGANSLDELTVVYSVSAEGLTEGTELIAKLTKGNSQETFPVEFAMGHGKTSKTYKAKGGDKDQFTIVVSPEDVKDGKALAFQGHSVKLYDAKDETTPIAETRKRTALYSSFKSVDNPRVNNTAINSTAKVTLGNLPENTKITAVTAGGTIEEFKLTGGMNLLKEEKVIGANHATEFTLDLPNDKNLIGKELSVSLKNERGYVETWATGSVVTADNTIFGTDEVEVTKKSVASGLYQEAYDSKNNKLYVTRNDFGGSSSLLKLDPETLETLASTNVSDDNRVFGIAAPHNDHLWVTNTLSNSVAVYNAKDLSLIQQFDKDIVGHPRAVAINEESGKVYISSPVSKDESMTVIDGKTKQVSTVPTPGFAGAMGMEIDPETKMLYTTSFAGGKVMRLNTTNNDVTVFDLNKDAAEDNMVLERGTDVAYDHERNRLYIAGQKTNNLVVVDMSNGKVLKNMPTGDQPVGITYDKSIDKIVVLNRTSGTATVVDGESLTKVANLDVGNNPNFATTDGKGRIFMVNKQSQVGKDNDEVVVLKWKNAETEPDGDSTPGEGGDSTPGEGGDSTPGEGDNNTPGKGSEGSSSDKSGSSDGKDSNNQQGSGGALGPIAGVVALLGVLGALMFSLFNSGMMPAGLMAALPPQLKGMLG